ncbi:tyrosine-protein kinase Srms isoform 1-T1 [Discoglossus pictus]
MESFLKENLKFLGCLWEKIWPPREEQWEPSVITMPPILPTQLNRYDSHSEKVTVLYDFEARCPEEISVTVGEELCKISEEGDYIRAKKIGSTLVGLVPLNYVARPGVRTSSPTIQDPCYVEVPNRYEAELLLLSPPNTHGSYLIRPSDSIAGQYSLSVRNDNKVNHFRIQTNAKGEFYLQTERYFSSIQELVMFHKTNWKLLKCQLLKPCVQEVTPDTWERPRSEFKLIKKLGEGFFGQVWEGIWTDYERVAIKTFKQEDLNNSDFEKEISALKSLHHPNLIQLLAICSIGEPIYIVTELMTKGDLQKYLNVEGHSLRNHDLQHIIRQVADGMAYLEIKHVVHRDLAARNILVGDNLVCKISDFGLARLLKDDLYSPSSNTTIPIKWTSPEALKYSKYSTKSDVWSFGILLYEVYTFGQQPYKGMINREVIEKVTRGYRLPCPHNCSNEMYHLMCLCWTDSPQNRPTFEEIVQKLSAIQRSVRKSNAGDVHQMKN